jgi:nucleoside-diphosphate-sugar epimerase
MRVLVFGGTGFTGPKIVGRLHSLGHEVTIFHKGSHEPDLPSAVRHFHGDFADPPPELRRIEPEVVVHMWAMTEPATRSFVEQFRGIAGRAVVISSGDVYRAYGRLLRLERGPPDPIPLTENAPLRESRYPYRAHAPDPEHWTAQYDKILVEHVFTSQSELPAAILRFPAVLGPNEHNRFARWTQAMLRGDSELLVQDDWADWRWTHGFADDVAEAVVLAAINAVSAGRVYNVGELHTPTMLERLAEFAAIAGWSGRIIKVPQSRIPESERTSYDYAHHVVYDTTRIRTELGYSEVIPREKAIRQLLERA